MDADREIPLRCNNINRFLASDIRLNLTNDAVRHSNISVTGNT